MTIFRLLLLCLLAVPLAACNTTTNGSATTAASPSPQDAEMAARRQARRDFYRGPRGGATGR